MYLVGLAPTACSGVDDDIHRLTFGPISFQPAQIAIAAGIIAIATLANDLPKIHRFFDQPSFRVLLIGVLTGIPFLLVVKLRHRISSGLGPGGGSSYAGERDSWRYLIFLGAMAAMFIQSPTLPFCQPFRRGEPNELRYLDILKRIG